MRLLDKLNVYHGSEARTIELYHGDLTALEPEEAVDILVVSAFRGDYWPAPGTLIGALAKKNVSIQELATKKAIDLRKTCSCWLSNDLHNLPEGMNFKKIICFEPEAFMQAPLLVGDIFRCLLALLPAKMASTSVAMPLISTGDMGIAVPKMLDAILEAATHWMALGLPVHTLKIVVYAPDKVDEVHTAFEKWRAAHVVPTMRPSQNYKFDLFISYSHKNRDEVDFLVAELRHQHPALKIFLDRFELNPGMSWPQEIYAAIDTCHYVVAVYTPDYVSSKVCQHEFAIATYRQLNKDEQVLYPIFLYSADLPSSMGIIHYDDCREGDKQRLRAACTNIIRRLSSSTP